MKDRLTLLLAAVFALFLAGCDQPAQQEEPEQQPPTTTPPDEGGPAMTDPAASWCLDLNAHSRCKHLPCGPGLVSSLQGGVRMKARLTLLLAAVFALFLAGCDQPAQQEEPEQQPPTTTAPDEGGPAMTDPAA